MRFSDDAAPVRLDGDEFDVLRLTPTQVTLVSRTTGATVVERPGEVTQDKPCSHPQSGSSDIRWG